MSGHSGPRVVQSSIDLSMVLDSPKIVRAETNLLANWPWRLGTGSESYYSQNGDGNSRIIEDNPFGQKAIIWQTLDNDTTSNADGGWNTSSFPIDNTKTYRYSVWVKRKVLGNGSFYLGCHGYGATTGVTSNDSATWGANTNPYFVSTGWPEAIDTWYLVVGHIFPHDYTTLGDHPDSGWYTVGNPNKIRGIDDRDYRWHSTSTSANYRTYLYYSIDSTTHQLWYAPRVDLCDGSEPSIEELVSLVNNRTTIIGEVPVDNYGAVKNIQGGYYEFDGTGSVLSMGNIDLRKDFSLECFVNFDGLSAEGLFGHGIASSRQGLHIVVADSGRIRFGMYSNDTDFSNLGLQTGVWYHMVFTYNHSTFEKKMYLNGREKSGSPLQTQTSYTHGPNELRVGMNYSSGNNSPLDGKVALFRMYSKVLSKRDVKRNFSSRRSRYGL